MYNKMLTTMLPVERPLVDKQFQKIDKTIYRGVKVMSWSLVR